MTCIGGSCTPAKTQILLIGPFASGKTTILRLLSGKTASEQTIPTLGLRQESQHIEEYKVTFLDMGGKAELVPEWPLFYGCVYGVIYAIETTDYKHAEENARQLLQILKHPDVEGKPFLIVGTKSNSANAMKEEMLLSRYDLDNILSQHRNAQFCFAEDKPHWIRGSNQSFDAKSNISCNMDSSDVEIPGKKQVTKGDNRSFDKLNQDFTKMRLNSNKDVQIETPRTSGYPDFTSLYVEPNYEKASLVIELMGLRQGIIWLLEFVEGNREQLTKRIAKANKENDVTSTKRKLMKIQHVWERQCSKRGAVLVTQEKSSPNEGKPLATGKPSHGAFISSPSSRLLVQRLSKLNAGGQKDSL